MNPDNSPTMIGEWTWHPVTGGIWIKRNGKVIARFGGLIWPQVKQAVEQLFNAHNAAFAAERERYDDLQRSVMDLSHPNCKGLLNERNEAREQLAAESNKKVSKSIKKALLIPRD